MKYTVLLQSAAGTWVDVEADTPQEAAQRGEEDAHVSICHQCAGQVDVGDEWEVVEVLDEDSNEVDWH